LEQSADELDALPLVPGRVRRVKPDEGSNQLDGVVYCGHASTILPHINGQ
jgi:hypothetical protein